MKKTIIAAMVLFVATGLAACGEGEKPKDISFDESRCPIEIVSTSKTISPIPTFVMTVKNISPYSITGFNAGGVFFDSDGKALASEPVEIPFEGTLDPILPDSTVELQSLGEENAASLNVAFKDCVYLKPATIDPAYGDLPYVWKNPAYDKEIKKLLGGN